MIRDVPSKQSVYLQGFSPEQLLEVVSGARFEHYILSGTKCNARLDRWSHGGFSVDKGSYSFAARVVGSFPKNRLCLGYMRKLSAPTWVNAVVADDTTVEFYPDGCELNYRAAPHGTWVAIEFEEASFQAAARDRLGHDVHLPWQHMINFRIPHSDRVLLDNAVDLLWDHPVSGAMMIRPILGIIAEILHKQQRKAAHASSSKSQHQQMILRRSDDYLRENLDKGFEIQALASASGTTVRTLQRLFHQAYGVTPHEWARCAALHQARRRLQSTKANLVTVEGIALDCGFRHIGRFSEYYRDLFGELPSHTLHAGTQTQHGRVSSSSARARY